MVMVVDNTFVETFLYMHMHNESFAKCVLINVTNVAVYRVNMWIRLLRSNNVSIETHCFIHMLHIRPYLFTGNFVIMLKIIDLCCILEVGSYDVNVAYLINNYSISS